MKRVRIRLSPDYLSYMGTEWAPRPHLEPMLVSAVEAQRSQLLPSNPVRNAWWALDYFFTPVRFRIGGRRSVWQDRRAGTAHLYPPLTEYWEDSGTSGTVVHHAWLNFTFADGVDVKRFVTNRQGYATFKDPGGLLGGMMQRMARIGYTEGESGFWCAQSLLLSVIDLLHRGKAIRGGIYQLPARVEDVEIDPLVLSVRSFLNANLREPLDLAAVAAAVHVSVSTLTHRYSIEAGESPMQTLMRMRITAAKTMLIQGHSVKEAAAHLKFCNQQHLSRMFRQIEGLPPREFMARQWPGV